MTDAHAPVVGIDPRLSARRVVVARGVSRHRLIRLLVLVVVAAIALAAATVLRSPILDVDDIVVEGAAMSNADEIRSAAGITLGTPLLLTDLGRAEAAIELLPWVADAQVTRDLPGSVRVRITERTPAALVSVRGRTALVGTEGRVLGDAPEPSFPPFVSVITSVELPAIGETMSSDILPALELAARVRANPAGVVAAVHLSPSLRLHLFEGGLVEFGDARELDAKIEAFRTVYARVDRTCLDEIDVRVPTHPVLTRDPDCS